MTYPLVLDLAADGIPVAVTRRVLGLASKGSESRSLSTVDLLKSRFTPSIISLLAVIFAGPSPALLSPTPEVAPVLSFPHSIKTGCTERRLCILVARASYTDTPKEAPAITTAQMAMTVLAFTGHPPIEEASAAAESAEAAL